MYSINLSSCVDKEKQNIQTMKIKQVNLVNIGAGYVIDRQTHGCDVSSFQSISSFFISFDKNKKLRTLFKESRFTKKVDRKNL